MNALELVTSKYAVDPAARHFPIALPISRSVELIGLWRELEFTAGAEIGVEQGIFSAEILAAMPSVKLYCVDPWRAYNRYMDHVSQGKLDRYYDEAIERLAKYIERCQIIRQTSMDAVGAFADNSLDFVYVDANHHFDFVVRDIIEWSRKVRSGGIVSGHDYRSDKGRLPFHVIEATQAYASAYKIRPWFITRADGNASWFWVKP